MGIKEGLLALLSEGPKHGYQLKVDLEAATGDAITINVGQVYTTLQRLERDGHVRSGEGDVEGRVVYQITPSGGQLLREWASRPEDLAAAGRDGISIKVLIALHSEGLDPAQVVATQRSSTMSLLQDLTRLRAEDSGEDLAWQLHLDRLIYSAEAELKWLDRVEERLEEAKPARSPVAVDIPEVEGVASD